MPPLYYIVSYWRYAAGILAAAAALWISLPRLAHLLRRVPTAVEKKAQDIEEAVHEEEPPQPK